MTLQHILLLYSGPVLNHEVKDMNMESLPTTENQLNIRVILLNLLQDFQSEIIRVLNAALTRLIITGPVAVRLIS
jgi:hypothetical protein